MVFPLVFRVTRICRRSSYLGARWSLWAGTAQKGGPYWGSGHEDAEAGRLGDGLAPTSDAQLVEDVLRVAFDRARRDVELATDLTIAQMLREEGEDLELAFGQRSDASESPGLRRDDDEEQ